MSYIVATPTQEEDQVDLNGKLYKIRFTAKHAEHVWDNYNDPAHGIKHREIQNLVRRSIVVHNKRNVYFCVSRYKKKVFQTVVVLEGTEMLVKTCFVSNIPELRALLKEYEDSRI